eukprot:999542-Alexandrium_andersonii.AAC.1
MSASLVGSEMCIRDSDHATAFPAECGGPTPSPDVARCAHAPQSGLGVAPRVPQAFGPCGGGLAPAPASATKLDRSPPAAHVRGERTSVQVS